MIRKRNFCKLNKEHANRGAALVSVIIVMTVVSILGLLALSVSYDTYRMKQVEKHASENFYGAEKALEEVATGLQQILSKCYADAYTEVIANYDTYDTAQEMQMKYEEKVLVALTKALQVEGNSGLYDVSNMQSLISDSNATFFVNGGTGKNYLNITNAGFYLRNVGVIYEEGGYSDQIVTDIKISVPPVVFEKIVNLPSLVDFSLIAEHGINAAGGEGANGKKSEYTVSGKIFAGVPDKEVNVVEFLDDEELVSISLTPGTIVTTANGAETEVICEGNVELNGTASFTSDQNTILWAQGIVANAAKPSEILSGVEVTNTLSLLGTTYVKDDTTLNGAKNQLTLGGRYFGYSSSAIDASESSAILINGVDTAIDLSAVNTLVISGSSFVGTKGEAYDKLNLGHVDFNAHDVFMGESVAVKGNQLIYMVPKECDGIQSNPMTYEQYLELKKIPDWQRKVLTTQIAGLGRSIASYGDVKITPVFTNKMGGAVYLYLEFANVNAANKFFMDNYGVSVNGQKAKDIVDTYVKAFKFAEEGQIYTAGNYLIGADGNSAVYTAATSGIEDMNLSDAFARKCEELQFDQLIDKNLVKQLTAGLEDNTFIGSVDVVSEDILRTTTTIELVVVDNEGGDAFVLDSKFKGTGVVIATGDVVINQDHMIQDENANSGNPITGMILCGGELKIEAAVQNISGNSDVVAKALRIENSKGISGMDLFKGYGGNAEEIADGGAEKTGKIDIRNCVTFENWKTQ